MNKNPNIFLVGFMGTGKTAAGKIAANRLGMTFVDMDEIIEQRQGRPISRIFAQEGEQRFRTLERELVRELASKTGQVVAAGGGVVLNPANIADFNRTGVVVCLCATAETILSRAGNDANRPLLAGPDKLGRIKELLEKRRPLYDNVPLRIQTDGLSVEEEADRIIEIVRLASAAGAGAKNWRVTDQAQGIHQYGDAL